jgi:hypothetical protein
VASYGPLVLSGSGTVRLSVSNTGTLKLLGNTSASLAFTAPVRFGTISGTLFNDKNLDGKYDTGDLVLAGRTVFIDKNLNGKPDIGENAVTNALGVYSFTNLAAGTFRVIAVAPTGYRVATPGAGYIDVPLIAGQIAGGCNFALTTTALLSGTVYNDVNLDGKYDSGDLPLAGRTVYLDKNKNGRPDLGEPTTLTNAAGGYSFVLAAAASATYRVATVVPAGYRIMTATPTYFDATLAAGGVASGKSFALTPTAHLAGTLFNDADGNGAKASTETYLSGWKVFIDANGDGKWESTEKFVLTTTAGAWSFNLAAGKYRVNVVPPTGWKLTTLAATTLLRTMTAGQVSTGIALGAKHL